MAKSGSDEPTPAPEAADPNEMIRMYLEGTDPEKDFAVTSRKALEEVWAERGFKEVPPTQPTN